MSGLRQSGGATTRVSSGKKRARVGWGANAGGESDDSDSAGSATHRASSRPKKRFIWPEELHRDFIAAVFDMGLKKADPSRLKELMPKKDRSADPDAMRSCLQKLRSFRYQMRSALSGDNLDTPEELAQKGIVSPGGGLAFSLGHHRNGSASLPSLAAGAKAMDMDELRDAFEVPRELASTIERLDSQQMKRSVELMGQCVQVQRSACGVLLHAIEAQDALRAAIVEKVRQMGLPVSSINGLETHRWNEGSMRYSGSLLDGAEGGNGPRSGGVRPSVSVRVQGSANSWPIVPDQSSANSSQASETGELNANTGSLGLLALSAGNTTGSVSGPGGLSATSTVIRGAQQLTSKDYLVGERGLSAFLNAAAGAASASGPSSEVSASVDPLRTGAIAQEASAARPPAPPPSSLVPSPPSGAASSVAGVTPFDHVEWEAGNLLSVQQEETDESSLRKAMKRSMDIHRLMRSRQQDQLQLHAQQRQQVQQHIQQHQLRKEGRTPGVVPVGSASLLPPPPPKNSTNKAGSLQSTLGQRTGVTATTSTPSSITTALLNFKPSPSGAEAGPLPAAPPSVNPRLPGGGTSSNSSPPPPSAGGSLPGSNSSVTVKNSRGGLESNPNPNADGGAADVVDPPALAVDWNWDEDALDAQLFSFLLDGEP